MNKNLKNYPKNGTHWEKNVWKERFEKELRETREKHPLFITLENFEPTIEIKEVLGE